MHRDQLTGILLMAVSIAVIAAYAWLVFLSPWAQLVVQLTAFLVVAFIFWILGWVGYTLATMPPPKPMEEIGAEVKKALEEAKKLIEEARKTRC